MRKILPYLGAFIAISAPSARAADIFGGRGADPAGVWREISGVVDEAAEDLGIPPEVAEAFKQKMTLSYEQQNVQRNGQYRRLLSGRMALPTCNGAQGFSFRMESHEKESQLSALDVEDVMGEYLELALVDFAACEDR